MGLSFLARGEPEVVKRVGSGMASSKQDRDVLNSAHMGNHIQKTSISCSLNRQEVERYRFCIFVVIGRQSFLFHLKFSNL